MNQPQRILYAPPRGMGDLIFSLPLLHSLREAFPQAKIFVPLPQDKDDIMHLVGFLEHTRKYLPRPRDDPLARERWLASRRGDTQEKYRIEKIIYDRYLAGEQYDLAILPKPFTIDTILCPRQLTEARPHLQNGEVHMVDRFLRFADELGIKKSLCFDLNLDFDAPVTPQPGQLDSSKPYIVFHLGTSKENKMWTRQGYQETAQWCRESDHAIILTGDPARYEDARTIAAQDGGICNTLLPKGYCFDLSNLARLLAKSSAVMSPDTGVAHLADAAGARVIGLYGPTSPGKFAPYHNRERVISRYAIDKDIRNIPAEEVIGKLQEVLA